MSGGKVELPLQSGTLDEKPGLVVDGPGKAEIADNGTITVTPNADAKPGDKITVSVKNGNGDVIDTVTVTVSGVTPDKQVAVEGAAMTPVEVVGVPQGATVAATTNTVSGAPDVTDWQDTEEERVVTSTVTVSAGGDTKFELPVEVTVQRDTDGDGTPDVVDADDDNDGVKDAEEAVAGTDPKDAQLGNVRYGPAR
ncbi:hypothetical protein GCM10028828_10680 [Corynebacterium tapiri]